VLKKWSTKSLIFLFVLLVIAPPAFSAQLQQESGFDPVDTYIETEMEKWDLPGMALAIVKDGEIA